MAETSLNPMPRGDFLKLSGLFFASLAVLGSGVILSMNPAQAQEMGKKLDELLGLNIPTDPFPIVVPKIRTKASSPVELPQMAAENSYIVDATNLSTTINVTLPACSGMPQQSFRGKFKGVAPVGENAVAALFQSISGLVMAVPFTGSEAPAALLAFDQAQKEFLPLFDGSNQQLTVSGDWEKIEELKCTGPLARRTMAVPMAILAGSQLLNSLEYQPPPSVKADTPVPEAWRATTEIKAEDFVTPEQFAQIRYDKAKIQQSIKEHCRYLRLGSGAIFDLNHAMSFMEQTFRLWRQVQVLIQNKGKSLKSYASVEVGSRDSVIEYEIDNSELEPENVPALILGMMNDASARTELVCQAAFAYMLPQIKQLSGSINSIEDLSTNFLSSVYAMLQIQEGINPNLSEEEFIVMVLNRLATSQGVIEPQEGVIPKNGLVSPMNPLIQISTTDKFDPSKMQAVYDYCSGLKQIGPEHLKVTVSPKLKVWLPVILGKIQSVAKSH